MHVWTCLSCLHVNIRNVTHARVSLYYSLLACGLWLRLIEDTTPARGALASALATRTFAGSIIFKIDIEGAEYMVIDEMVSSGKVCEYARRGYAVVIVLEEHVKSIGGAFLEHRRRHEGNKWKLIACNVTLVLRAAPLGRSAASTRATTAATGRGRASTAAARRGHAQTAAAPRHIIIG